MNIEQITRNARLPQPERGPDALQLFVRGFETAEAGDQIVDLLESYGFSVREKITGDSDTMGGLIETAIADANALELPAGGLPVLKDALRAGAETDFPRLLVQYRAYRLTDDSEI